MVFCSPSDFTVVVSIAWNFPTNGKAFPALDTCCSSGQPPSRERERITAHSKTCFGACPLEVSEVIDLVSHSTDFFFFGQQKCPFWFSSESHFRRFVQLQEKSTIFCNVPKTSSAQLIKNVSTPKEFVEQPLFANKMIVKLTSQSLNKLRGHRRHRPLSPVRYRWESILATCEWRVVTSRRVLRLPASRRRVAGRTSGRRPWIRCSVRRRADRLSASHRSRQRVTR